MTELFAKVLVKMLTHPKVLPIGNAALGVWLRGTLYAKVQGTNGYVPPEALRAFAGIRPEDDEVVELVATGLWEPEGNGWVIHDWEDHQIDPADYAEMGRHSAAKRESADYAALAQKRWHPDANGCERMRTAHANGCERPMRTGCEEIETKTKTKTETGTNVPNVAKATPPIVPHAETKQVFEAWMVATGRNGNTLLTAERVSKIKARLKQYPPEDVLDAVKGVMRSPWHVENHQTDITFVLRNGANLEKFRDMERDAGPTRRRNPEMTAAEMGGDIRQISSEDFARFRTDAPGEKG